MEMAQVRYVLAAARTLNFTRAAEACGVTQPALTKGVRALEEQLGAPIFHREGRRVLLSRFGESMLPHLQHIVDEAEAARTLAMNFRLLERVPLRLGVLATVGHVRFARFLAAFEHGNPGVDLSVTEATAPALRDRLRDGEIDAAVATLDEGFEAAFRTEPLYAERYVVVFPPDHPFGARNALALADLSGQPYVDRLACEMREMVMQVCGTRGVELYARFRSEREDWVQAMVLAGIGFAFMPEYSVSLPGLLQRPLVDPPVERKVGIATAPGRPHSPALVALLQASRRFAWPG